MLPSWLEPQRADIEQHLPPLRSADQSPATPSPESAAKLTFTHRFVPAEDARNAPTFLLLHGTGGDETDLLQLGHALFADANLLSPRGRVLEHGMPRFFRRLAEGVFDREDLIAQTNALADFVGAAAQHYGFDPNRVVAVGYSNGANIAASLLLLHPQVLAGALLFRPMVPLEPTLVPDLTDVPVFISAARRDEIVEPEQTERLAALLEGFGAQVTVEWQPGGHALVAGDVNVARGWITAQSLTRPAISLPPAANLEEE
jgi:phospholipase/carboxylesterase/glyoxalase family protein